MTIVRVLALSLIGLASVPAYSEQSSLLSLGNGQGTVVQVTLSNGQGTVVGPYFKRVGDGQGVVV